MNETIMLNTCVNCICLPVCINKELKEFVKDCVIISDKVKEYSLSISALGTLHYIYFNGVSRQFSIVKKLASDIYTGHLWSNVHYVDVSVSVMLDDTSYYAYTFIAMDEKGTNND